jgi:hypothetical protein
VASASADGAPYLVALLGRRGAADGHADGQPDHRHMGESGQRLPFVAAPSQRELERLRHVRLGLLDATTLTDRLRHFGDLRQHEAIFTRQSAPRYT